MHHHYRGKNPRCDNGKQTPDHATNPTYSQTIHGREIHSWAPPPDRWKKGFNLSINSIFDFKKDSELQAYLLENNSPIADMIDIKKCSHYYH